MPSGEIRLRRRIVVNLNPVGTVAVLIGKAARVGCHEFAYQHSARGVDTEREEAGPNQCGKRRLNRFNIGTNANYSQAEAIARVRFRLSITAC